MADESLTVRAWLPAGEARAVHPEIAGLVRNCPGPGDRAVVVRYRAIGDGRPVDLLVPLDPAGNPTGAFAFPGGTVRRIGPDTAGDYEPVVGGLDAARLAAVVGRRGAAAADRRALRAHLDTADWHPVTPARPRSYDGWETPAHPDAACVLAFRTDGDSYVVAVSMPDRSGPVRVEPGTHVMVLPVSVDRPPGDRATSAAVAVAVTPVTVAADAIAGAFAGAAMVVVTPLFLLGGLRVGGG